jgi:hypothetical protein
MEDLEGRGAAFNWLRNLTQEKLDTALRNGLTFDRMIEARAEGDNAVIANVCFYDLYLSSATRCEV